MRYQKILDKRGNLPRREILEDRVRKQLRQIDDLKKSHLEDLAFLEAELSVTERLLATHSFSTRTLTFLRDIEESIPAVSGVYSIEVDDSPVYVGESQNVQRRCLDHAEAIVIPQEQTAPLYRYLGTLDPQLITFQLLEEVDDDKRERLTREGWWAQHYTDLGFKLHNAIWKGRRIHGP